MQLAKRLVDPEIGRFNMAAKPKAEAKKKPAKTSRCWTGYEPTPGKKPGAKGSCKKKD